MLYYQSASDEGHKKSAAGYTTNGALKNSWNLSTNWLLTGEDEKWYTNICRRGNVEESSLKIEQLENMRLAQKSKWLLSQNLFK